VTIEGGTIEKAKGGDYAAGIGGGQYSDGDVRMTGGTIQEAVGGTYAAGIGGGDERTGTVEITGGTVERAIGGSHGAGIGGGHTKEDRLPGDGTVTLGGGARIGHAKGGESAAGIGSGSGATGKVRLMGCEIDLAEGGAGYPAIGGAPDKANKVTIVNQGLSVSKNDSYWGALNNGLPYEVETDITELIKAFRFLQTFIRAEYFLPKTGDASMLGAWMALLGMAGVGLNMCRKKQ